MIKFPYLECDEDNVEDLLESPQTCSLCGNQGRCFLLNSYHPGMFLHVDGIKLDLLDLDKTGEDEKFHQYGCLTCLEAGRFVFLHDTELDEVSKAGFVQPSEATALFARSSIDGLLRTPHFKGAQHEFWLVHCNDFMTYVGMWEPIDFVNNAPDGDGKKLFLQMLADSDNFWDYHDDASVFPEIVNPDGDWAFACFTFRCRHCGKIRAFEEMD